MECQQCEDNAYDPFHRAQVSIIEIRVHLSLGISAIEQTGYHLDHTRVLT